MVQKISSYLQRTFVIAIQKYKALRGIETDQLPTNNANSEQIIREIVMAPYPLVDECPRRNGNLILKTCPNKIIEKLSPDPNDPPYGWGLYLEEGFAIPELISTLGLFLLFCLVFGVLIYCIKEFAKVGFSIFGLWGSTIGFCALIATLLFKYADAMN